MEEWKIDLFHLFLYNLQKGHVQAEKTGVTLREMMKSYGSSPFQRCIDTSMGIIKGMQLSQVTLRLDIGLGEWMCERFFDEVCPAVQLISQQQQKIARQQAYSYSLKASSPDNNTLPSFSMDYAYNNSIQSDFNFPERYTDMLGRFDDTRLQCLQLHENDDNAVIIFVTHAVGVNALLDGFRNKQTRPQEMKYCNISCVRPSNASNGGGGFMSPGITKQQLEDKRSGLDCYSDQSDEDGGNEYIVGMNGSPFNNGVADGGTNAWSIELEVWDRHL
jgi:broad specificity phosphatase PhoE